MPFHYYADRESPWLLAQWMPETAPVRALRAASYGHLLDRPAMRPVLGRCDGRLEQLDVLALAHADRAFSMPHLSVAARAGLEQVFQARWFDFELTFDEWEAVQTTRGKWNLVVQLGFSSDHADLLGRHFKKDMRGNFEFYDHPVRREGRPTLAWARLDLDPASGCCLIEEVQSDWLRNVADEREWLGQSAPQSRDARATAAYERELRARYGKIWPKAMLLGVLMLLRDTLGYRDVWMHQHEAGAVLKDIRYALPPRSLYSQLPKSFCFVPTRGLPDMLSGRLGRFGARLRALKRLQGPLFWHVQF